MTIIKSFRHGVGYRVGQTYRHVFMGLENLSVRWLRGTFADYKNFFDDARAAGKQYAVRQYIIATYEELTDEQLIEIIVRLARDVGFDIERIVLVEHVKHRADPLAAKRHFHLFVPEFDIVTGQVLPSRNSYIVQDMHSRLAEWSYGHEFVEGKFTAAVIKRLRRRGYGEAADALYEAFPDQGFRPRETLSATVIQKLKRVGKSAPELKHQVRAAWRSTRSDTEFLQRVSELGLSVEIGTSEPPAWIIRADGDFLCKLAGAVGASHEIVNARMGDPKDVVRQTAAASNPPAAREPSAPAEPTPERDRKRAGRRRYPGEAATGLAGELGERHQTGLERHRGDQGHAARSGSGQEGVRRRAEGDFFIQGLIANRARVQQVAAVADEVVEPPRDRILRLVEKLDRDAQAPIAAYEKNLPEPRELDLARASVEKINATQQLIHDRLRALAAKISAEKSRQRSLWSRVTGSASAPLVALEARYERNHKAFEANRREYSGLTGRVKRLQADYKHAQAKRDAALLPAAIEAKVNLAIASEIRGMIRRAPMIVHFGFFQLFLTAWVMHEGVVRKSMYEAAHAHSEPEPDYEIRTDIHGVGQLPKPK